MAPPRPTLTRERAFWRTGLRSVAGIDEVGRGALAGPLVAAAVVLPCCAGPALRRLQTTLAEVCDSKLLSRQQREALDAVIREHAIAVALGAVAADELDAIGVSPANRMAMERAVLSLPREPELLLIDAAVLDLGLPQVGLINGDTLCLSVAAASIVAKVARDRMMTEAAAVDDRFGFDVHKGYGVPAHLAALARYGPGPLHRRCFAPVARAALKHRG